MRRYTVILRDNTERNIVADSMVYNAPFVVFSREGEIIVCIHADTIAEISHRKAD
jgi:hypothetical protein